MEKGITVSVLDLVGMRGSPRAARLPRRLAWRSSWNKLGTSATGWRSITPSPEGICFQRHRRMGREVRNEHADLHPQICRDGRAAPHSTSRPDSRLSCSLEASWAHAYTSHFVSRSIFTLLDDRDRMHFGQGSEEEDKTGSLTKIHGRSSDAVTRLSQMFSSSGLGKTRRLRRPTHYCSPLRINSVLPTMCMSWTQFCLRWPQPWVGANHPLIRCPVHLRYAKPASCPLSPIALLITTAISAVASQLRVFELEVFDLEHVRQLAVEQSTSEKMTRFLG